MTSYLVKRNLNVTEKLPISFFSFSAKKSKENVFGGVCERERETLPSPPPKGTLLVHLGVNREGVFVKPPYFTHYCNKGRSFVN